MHVDDLTGLSLEVLLFVEIAVRRPFEGKALHSTSGLLSLEHDDEQEGFVHLTFVHARHGRTSPCSCNQGIEKTRVSSREPGVWQASGRRNAAATEGGLAWSARNRSLVSTKAQPWSHLLQLRILGIPRDRSLGTPVIGQTAFCVWLCIIPLAGPTNPLTFAVDFLYMISFSCHWRGKFTAFRLQWFVCNK